MLRVSRFHFAKAPYAKLFRHSTVLSSVFAADARKIAIVVERPGMDVQSFTYGRLQRDVLSVADAIAKSGAIEDATYTTLTDPSSRGGSVFSRKGPILPVDEEIAARSDAADDGRANVALLCRPSYEFVVGLLAVWSLNLMAVPMCDQHHYEGEMTHIVENSRARLMLSETSLLTSKLPPPFLQMARGGKGANVFDVSACIDLRDLLQRTGATGLDETDSDGNPVVELLDPVPQSATNISTTVDLLSRIEHIRKAGQERTSEEVDSEIATRFVERHAAPSPAPGPISFELDEPEKLNVFYRRLLSTLNSSPPTGSDALMIYTSGTTAKPKGVVHTHASVSNQVNVLRQAWRWSPDDTILHTLPLHHVHGLVNVLLCSLASAAKCIFTPFDNSTRIAQRLIRGDITLYMAVPTIYTKLIEAIKKTSPVEQTAFQRGLSASLRLMVCGSAALPVPVLQQFHQVSGHVLLERYGMTEVGMALSQPYLPVEKRAAGTVGTPLPTVSIQIVSGGDESQGIKTGRMVLTTASLFDRYWRNSKATLAEVYVCPVTGQRYFETGDTVGLDKDGNYTILGRTSVDIIKRSGYKLSALEIEAALLLAKATVAEVAVFGVPHPTLGEAVAAVVAPTADALKAHILQVPTDGFVLGRGEGNEQQAEKGVQFIIDAVKDAAATNLAPYKRPHLFVIVTHIPRNAMGKVNKKELKKTLFPTGS